MSVDNAQREELSQSRARLAITCVVLAGFALCAIAFPRFRTNGLATAAAIVGAYGGFALVWHLAVIPREHSGTWRRYVTIVGDIAVVSGTMIVAGVLGAFYYPLFSWIAMGNGLRFGHRHLVFGVVCALVGFGAVLHFSPYWQDHRGIGYGLLAGLVVLPVFYASVAMRLRNLNGQLQVQLERSQVAEKAKGEFLANMSHEIRTPLNGVLGMAGVMRDGSLPPDQRQHLDVIIRSGESLLHIINDILDYSKMSSGHMRIEQVPFDLVQVARDVESLLEPAAADKGLTLVLRPDPDLPPALVGDPTRVRQILLNLVGNAIKFTASGRVTVNMSASADGAGVTLAVTDTGIGIPADRLDAIFDRFEQADTDTTRRFGGTGLGLAICSHLAELMGGTISVSSTVGVGSTFTIVLPLSASAEPLTGSGKPDGAVRFNLRAVVADDNAINRRVAALRLETLGIAAVTVADGQAALDALDDDVDLLLLDINMPGLDGLETARRVRSRPDRIARVPIVALTGDGSDDDVERSLAAGMNAHLVKPFDPDELAAILVGRFGFATSAVVPEEVGS